MRRLLIPLALLLLACKAIFPDPTPTPVPTGTPTLQPSPTFTASPTPTATLPPTPTLTPTPDAAQGYQVRFHPDGPLYVGDRISLEVIAPHNVDQENLTLDVSAPGAQGELSVSAPFMGFGIGGRGQATLRWFWDTRGLVPGDYFLRLSVQPIGPDWTQKVSLLPAQDVPPPEPGARWDYAETDCCLVYYITGTEAQRDLPALLEMVDKAASSASDQLAVPLAEAVPIVFMPRLLGHGGFAANEIAVSYLDRNYAGGSPENVIHHEIVHLLDGRLGGDYRPSILVEGLAVYLSGGHFKPEPLMPRAAALLPPEPGCAPLDLSQPSPTVEPCGLDWYIPLDELTNEFYFAQHEIGYLEGAALVEFMVETWGWQPFDAFYRDIDPPGQFNPATGREDSESDMLSASLQAHFNLDLFQLQVKFREALRQELVTTGNANDVRLTVAYYDTVRRYQQLLDPSAYFLTAWLPDTVEMREKHIVADFLRRPSQPVNLEIEGLLVQAGLSLRQGDFAQVEALLAQVNSRLDSLPSPFSALFLSLLP